MSEENGGPVDFSSGPLGIKAMVRTLNHAPTYGEGVRLVNIAIRSQRMDRRLMNYHLVKVREEHDRVDGKK